MPKFLVTESFLFNGQLYREGSSVTIDETLLKAEIARGKHPKRDRWLSGILTHCVPADNKTAAIISKATGKEVEAATDEGEEETEETEGGGLDAIRQQFDDMGAAYDKRWGTAKLRRELIRAKKARGL